MQTFPIRMDTQENKNIVAMGKRSYGGWGIKTGERLFIVHPFVPVEFLNI